MTTTIHPADPAALVAAWERQQEAYIPRREDRFALMLDLLADLSPGRPGRPRVLDLACGPGSLSARVLDRFPAAEVVALDMDPLLLELGRVTLADRPNPPVWVQADLRDPAWPDLVPGRHVDAVLSTTALHWLGVDDLTAVYRRSHGLLTPGGVLLNGDYLPSADPDGPVSTAVQRLADARRDAAVVAGADDWNTWWSHARSAPALATQVPGHDALAADRVEQEAPTLDQHVAALRAAGFTDVGLVWSDLAEGLLCAVDRPDGPSASLR